MPRSTLIAILALSVAIAFAGWQVAQTRATAAAPPAQATSPAVTAAVPPTADDDFKKEVLRDIKAFVTDYCKKMDKFEDEITYNNILANHGGDMAFFWQMYSLRTGRDPSAPPGGEGAVGFGMGRRENASVSHGVMDAVLQECVKSHTVLSQIPKARVNEVIVDYLDAIAPLANGRKTPEIANELRAVRKKLEIQRPPDEWKALKAEETRLTYLLEGR